MRLSLSSRYSIFLQIVPLLLVTCTLWLSSPTLFGIIPVASAWEWTDYVVGGSTEKDEDGIITTVGERRRTLTNAEISGLRVRDLKRRLGRGHGYSANELGRMLDKKDLISALIEEETKLRNKNRSDKRRKLFLKALIIAILCVVAIVGWPLWTHLSEVLAVNWTVFYDQKRHEISQCWELRSAMGAFGVAMLTLLDLLRLWLSCTVILSWFLSNDSRYRRFLLPIPTLSIKPGQFMGEQVRNSGMASWGMNVAPMVIRWGMGYLRTKVEYLTGKSLSTAARLRRQKCRSGETKEERKTRKAAKKAAKRTVREERERQQREIWEKETVRRKEMADRATEQLFGDGDGGSGSGQEKKPNQENSEITTNNEEQKEPTVLNKDYEDAIREFEADIDGLEDMNDLD